MVAKKDGNKYRLKKAQGNDRDDMFYDDSLLDAYCGEDGDYDCSICRDYYKTRACYYYKNDGTFEVKNANSGDEGGNSCDACIPRTGSNMASVKLDPNTVPRHIPRKSKMYVMEENSTTHKLQIKNPQPVPPGPDDQLYKECFSGARVIGR